MPKSFQERALEEVVAWVNSEDNVRAVVLTGSGARGAQDMDELSDLDIELYVRNPDKLLNSSGWYSRFGKVLVVEALPNPEWHPTRLVYYAGGKIDFMVAPDEALSKAKYERPFRVLVDKDDKAGGLRIKAPKGAVAPVQLEFDECNNWFWAAALMCAKCVVRNEPWLAKMRDWDLKTQLLRMIEWDHKARYGWNYETWYQGKRLDKWMDGDVRQRLADCWARFQVEDVEKALTETVKLFEELAERTAKATRLKTFDSKPADAEVERILAMSRRNR